jgi:hypothetical protein
MNYGVRCRFLKQQQSQHVAYFGALHFLFCSCTTAALLLTVKSFRLAVVDFRCGGYGTIRCEEEDGLSER